jgi:hypothetical protein
MIAPLAAPIPAPFSVWLQAVSVKQTNTPEMIFFMSVLSIHRRYGRQSTVETRQGGDVWTPKITWKLRRAVGIDTGRKRKFVQEARLRDKSFSGNSARLIDRACSWRHPWL